MRVQGGKERCGAGVAGNVGVRSAIEEQKREVEMPVDGGHQHGARVIPGAHLVDVRSAVEERHGRLHLSFPRGVKQRRQATLGPDQARVPSELLGLWVDLVFLLLGVAQGPLHLLGGTDRSTDLL